MIDNGDAFRKAVENARTAYHQGNHTLTRYWARQAISISPYIEEPWLWLAAVSSPRASVEYLQKALSINPNSQRARQGMHWAIKRVRLAPKPEYPERLSPSAQAISSPIVARAVARVSRKGTLSPYLWIGIVVLLGVISTALVSPALGFNINSFFSKPQPLVMAQVGIAKASNTPTSTSTPTNTPTPTPTLTPTPTPTITPTPTPTETSTPTETPTPTDTPYPTEEYERKDLPLPGGNERWIDVDLSDQLVYAYEGEIIVNVFVVSTGTWAHPTVEGQYHIYVKYRYTDMAGPGYYLPDVPYTMYFYDGYGLHGTYWHNNFGTPMSHGCINLSIPDSEWLYHFADVGTLVNIHE